MIYRYGNHRIPSFNEVESSCPQALRTILDLVHDQNFVFTSERKDRREATETYAARTYNARLRERAYGLSHYCCDPEAIEWSELEWVIRLFKFVFPSFDPIEEEMLGSNYWYMILLCSCYKQS